MFFMDAAPLYGLIGVFSIWIVVVLGWLFRSWSNFYLLARKSVSLLCKKNERIGSYKNSRKRRRSTYHALHVQNLSCRWLFQWILGVIIIVNRRSELSKRREWCIAQRSSFFESVIPIYIDPATSDEFNINSSRFPKNQTKLQVSSSRQRPCW